MNGPRVWRDTDPIQLWLREQYTLDEDEMREKHMERILAALDTVPITKAERFVLLTYYLDCVCEADYEHFAGWMGITRQELGKEVGRIAGVVRDHISVAA